MNHADSQTGGENADLSSQGPASDREEGESMYTTTENPGQGQRAAQQAHQPRSEESGHDFASMVCVCTAAKAFNAPQDPALPAATKNNFVKGAAFSPDGTCLLTSSDDCVLRVFEVPRHALTEVEESASVGAAEVTGSSASSRGLEWRPCLHSVEGETIYDFAWYPYMSSSEPATCVFVSTSRDHPLHMWDAFSGALRATYRAYDHLDEVVAANSVCFNSTGTKIFAGYNRMIRVFDVAQPGRSFEARPTCKTRKSRTGQRGIISSLAFSPESLGGGLFAAGSYAKSVCLYSENSRGRAVAELGTASMGGVTHLKFSPDGMTLFSGSRKDDLILCWDVRRTQEVLCTFSRKADTNQQISFDVDPSGHYLATGSTDRQAIIYDIESREQVGVLGNQADAVGSVSFHPHSPLLGVCTGQRHFDLVGGSASDSDGSATCDASGTRSSAGIDDSLGWRNGVSLLKFKRAASQRIQDIV